MLIGYARTLSIEEESGLQAQMRDLTAAGCEDIFTDQVPLGSSDRPELQKALRFLRKGDILVVTKLDRLARSMANVMDIQRTLRAKGAELRILSIDLDTSTSNGQIMLRALKAAADCERSILLEGQQRERSDDGVEQAVAAALAAEHLSQQQERPRAPEGERPVEVRSTEPARPEPFGPPRARPETARPPQPANQPVVHEAARQQSVGASPLGLQQAKRG